MHDPVANDKQRQHLSLNRLSLFTFDAVDNDTVSTQTHAAIHFALLLLLTFHDRSFCALVKSLEQFTAFGTTCNNRFSQTDEQASKPPNDAHSRRKRETIRIQTLATTKIHTGTAQHRHTSRHQHKKTKKHHGLLKHRHHPPRTHPHRALPQNLHPPTPQRPPLRTRLPPLPLHPAPRPLRRTLTTSPVSSFSPTRRARQFSRRCRSDGGYPPREQGDEGQ